MKSEKKERKNENRREKKERQKENKRREKRKKDRTLEEFLLGRYHSVSWDLVSRQLKESSSTKGCVGTSPFLAGCTYTSRISVLCLVEVGKTWGRSCFA